MRREAPRPASADAFYAVGNDYQVVLTGATIDGQTVNAVLAHFSTDSAVSADSDIDGGARGSTPAAVDPDVRGAGPLRSWVHRQLNRLVLLVGDWPVVGRPVWFAFGQWQRLM